MSKRRRGWSRILPALLIVVGVLLVAGSAGATLPGAVPLFSLVSAKGSSHARRLQEQGCDASLRTFGDAQLSCLPIVLNVAAFGEPLISVEESLVELASSTSSDRLRGKSAATVRTNVLRMRKALAEDEFVYESVNATAVLAVLVKTDMGVTGNVPLVASEGGDFLHISPCGVDCHVATRVSIRVLSEQDVSSPLGDTAVPEEEMPLVSGQDGQNDSAVIPDDDGSPGATWSPSLRSGADGEDPDPMCSLGIPSLDFSYCCSKATCSQCSSSSNCMGPCCGTLIVASRSCGVVGAPCQMLVTQKVSVAYTATVAANTADLAGLIKLAVAETNSAYEASRVPIRMVLSETFQVSVPDSADSYTMLTAFRGTDRRGANVAVLLSAQLASCGRGFLDCTRYAADNCAYAVVKASCATGYYSFGHEIGHIQGLDHNQEFSSDPYARFTDNHGWVLKQGYPEDGAYRTVMAYSIIDEARIPFFSNPDLTIENLPAGQIGVANNARVLRYTRYAVAKLNTPDYFPTTSPPTDSSASTTTAGPTSARPTRIPTTVRPTAAPTSRSPTTRQPTAAPTTKTPTTGRPTNAPTSRSPTLTPTTRPTISPTEYPTLQPTLLPTPQRTTLVPTSTPTAIPTLTPANQFPNTQTPTRPTKSPTLNPTDSTRAPTARPSTSEPTRPTRSPTLQPVSTNSPSRGTFSPTNEAIQTIPPTTRSPTLRPTWWTRSPSSPPSTSPTFDPADITQTPSRPTRNPTSSRPSLGPITKSPTNEPTTKPTLTPTLLPTRRPSSTPSTTRPSNDPTSKPTRPPTSEPTKRPSSSPATTSPSNEPTSKPTRPPTSEPTKRPSSTPSTTRPSNDPTSKPTRSPTSEPTKRPSSSPVTTSPSLGPSTASPSKRPNKAPSATPTLIPTKEPTTQYPTRSPTDPPTSRPSSSPTLSPSVAPSDPTESPVFRWTRFPTVPAPTRSEIRTDSTLAPSPELDGTDPVDPDGITASPSSSDGGGSGFAATSQNTMIATVVAAGVPLVLVALLLVGGLLVVRHQRQQRSANTDVNYAERRRRETQLTQFNASSNPMFGEEVEIDEENPLAQSPVIVTAAAASPQTRAATKVTRRHKEKPLGSSTTGSTRKSFAVPQPPPSRPPRPPSHDNGRFKGRLVAYIDEDDDGDQVEDDMFAPPINPPAPPPSPPPPPPLDDEDEEKQDFDVRADLQ